ncbi:hypothetical protein H2201_000401 [Coniosporium apollinis]|uniref:Uncharacterized protein n=1 Tax=Coniosporium apollinis TaxID=61459 RepID=A0ABQ9P4M7_9PEZI|nr:hypothetical protein H2201_000401 [Coniosporium apollinis]
MADRQDPFTFFNENIPQWLLQLTSITSKINARHDEISMVPIPVSPTPAPLRNRKTGSTESLRPNDEQPETVHQAIAHDATSPVRSEDVPPAVRQHQQAMLANRKRKTASVISGNAMSGPLKYRTRSMIVVYYDSEVQKAFEGMVRNIGTGRNLLRKGKMAARMSALTDLSRDDEDEKMEVDDEDEDEMLKKVTYRPSKAIGFRTTRSRQSPGLGLGGAATEHFDVADKALEKAQALCEKGAHQFLRDGDCSDEIDGAKECFEEVLAVAEREVEKLKAQAERQKKKEEERKSSQEKKTAQEEPRQQPERMEMSSPTPAKIGQPMMIEVDDDDEDDEEWVMPPRPIRLTSRAC